VEISLRLKTKATALFTQNNAQLMFLALLVNQNSICQLIW